MALLPFRFFLRPILKFLEHWGYADEDHLGKSFQTMDSGLECQHDVTRFWNRTHQIGFRMSELFRKVDENLGLHILTCATQLSCKFQFCHCTLVTILFIPFARPFVNLAVCIRALFPKPASISGLVEHILEDAIFHRMKWCKFLWLILAGPSRHSSHLGFCL